MAILHNLKYNGNVIDSVSGTWTSSGTLTSQPTKGLNGNYGFGGGNLFLSETNTGTDVTLAVTLNNNNTTDSDGKIFDARGSGSLMILASDAVSNQTIYWYAGNGGALIRINVGTNINKYLRVVGTYNGTTGIIYINGVEKGRYTGTGHTNYTSIRIGQESAGSPNRRYIGDMDELVFDRGSTWSPANVKNDYLFLKGYF